MVLERAGYDCAWGGKWHVARKIDDRGERNRLRGIVRQFREQQRASRSIP